jgi:hypothetical protein
MGIQGRQALDAIRRHLDAGTQEVVVLRLIRKHLPVPTQLKAQRPSAAQAMGEGSECGEHPGSSLVDSLT